MKTEANIFMRVLKGPATLRRDGGFVWIILLMAVLSDTMHLMAILGNLTVAHRHLFGISLQASSSIGSVHMGLLFLFGPLASILVKTMGCRITQIVGGVCVCAGLGFSYFTSEPWHAYLLYSVLSAFGMISIYTATSTILAIHFEKRRYLAFALISLGFYVGMVVGPSLSQYLIDQVGYNKALPIMAAFHSIHIVAGVVYYQPSSRSSATDDGICTNSSSISKSGSGVSTSISSLNSLGRDDKQSFLVEDYPQQDTETAVNVKLSEEYGDLIEQDIELSPPGQESGLISERNTETVSHDAFDEDLKTGFLFLFKSKKVWALLASGLLWNLCSSSFFILINDFIVSNIGLTGEATAFGITIIGIGNIVGCIGVLLCSSFTFDRLLLHISCIVIYSTATIVMAFTNGKMMYYALCAGWGLGQGAQTANFLGIACDFCGAHRLALLLGLHLTAGGIGNMTGSPICGFLASKIGYRYGIIFSGACGIAGALAISPVAIMKARSKKDNIDHSSPTTDNKLLDIVALSQFDISMSMTNLKHNG